METKYNGWTNYATWRVNLEMFDGWDPTDVFDADVTRDQLEDYLRETAEQYVEDTSTPDGFANSYAMAFLSHVNWREIAEHIMADYFEVTP